MNSLNFVQVAASVMLHMAAEKSAQNAVADKARGSQAYVEQQAGDDEKMGHATLN